MPKTLGRPRVHVTHTFRSAPADVFAALGEHENLGPLFGAKVTRLRDGDTSRNGVGSARSLKIGPLPGFVETVLVAEPDERIEYAITQGGPLRNHRGIQVLTPTADGGTRLDYTIHFDAPVPGVAGLVAKVLTQKIGANLPKLLP
jgi:uncharacterized protein YndB with AHSA1/START domain